MELVFTLISMFITAVIGVFAYKISTKQANQDKRKIIETIYLSYCDAMKELGEKYNNYPDSAKIKLLHAMWLADLHNEKEIKVAMKDLLQLFHKGHMYVNDPNISPADTDGGKHLHLVNIHFEIMNSEKIQKIIELFQKRMGAL